LVFETILLRMLRIGHSSRGAGVRKYAPKEGKYGSFSYGNL
jgi:hypothetical protein